MVRFYSDFQVWAWACCAQEERYHEQLGSVTKAELGVSLNKQLGKQLTAEQLEDEWQRLEAIEALERCKRTAALRFSLARVLAVTNMKRQHSTCC